MSAKSPLVKTYTQFTITMKKKGLLIGFVPDLSAQGYPSDWVALLPRAGSLLASTGLNSVTHRQAKWREAEDTLFCNKTLQI